MMNNENGRSMVEMLGVLAIIGVLSVAGIGGYAMAMRKYKANEILNTASQLVILAKSYNAGSGITSKTDNATLGIPDTTLPSGVSKMEVTLGEAADIVTVTGAGFDGSKTDNPCGVAKDNAGTLFTIDCATGS